MTTEKFDDAFKKNVNDTFKLVQDSARAIIEAQSKQFAFATEAYSKLLNTFRNNDNPTGSPQQIIESIQQSFKQFSNLSTTTFKQTVEYSKQATSDLFSHEFINNTIASYRNQIKGVANLNQQYLDALPKYFKSTDSINNSSMTEKIKKNLDDNLNASAQQLHAIIESYNRIANPTLEYGTVFFNELNDHVNTTVDTNLKLWSKLLDAYNFSEPQNNEERFAKNTNNERKAKNTKETVEN